MTAFFRTSAHDAFLNDVIQQAGLTCHLCTGDPADRTAVLAQSIGSYTPSFSAITNGTSPVRRQSTVQEATNVTIGNGGGTLGHFCMIDGAELVHKVGAIGSPAYTDGQVITVQARDILTGEAVEL